MVNPITVLQKKEIPAELSGEGMFINPKVLEKTCKNTIETILLCLEYATKGTIYLIGPVPDLCAVRITSGIRDDGTIRWGLPEASDYNFPGKTWEKYRDFPGQALEAMGWCVERQESWTVENPLQDARSVRRQLFGEAEDFFHLEPVLVKKTDLYGEMDGSRIFDFPCPSDWQGNPIWQDTKYVVVATIKIHFLPDTIRRGDRATMIIKKLSRTLGTELLSIHVRGSYLRSREKLARERLKTANALAHELRNTLTKMGIVFSLINTVISFLREQWEQEFRNAFPFLEDKHAVLSRLNHCLALVRPGLGGHDHLTQLADNLAAEQALLAEEYFLPHQAELWVQNKIQAKWMYLITSSPLHETLGEEIRQLLKKLEKSVLEVVDENLTREMCHIPEEVRKAWLELAYTRFSANNIHLMERLIHFLSHPDVRIPHRQRIKKMLGGLKVLAEVISTVEERANKMLLSLEREPFRE
jgi:hypothetical protein